MVCFFFVIALAACAADPVIFSIGEVDQSSSELNWRDFSNIRFVSIEADGVTDPTLLPLRLINPAGPHPPERGDAAQEVDIIFRLKRDVSDAVLRLARGGDSVTLVTVDGSDAYRVTHTMLGSEEGGIFGSYDLSLGPLEKGEHTINLSMPDDGLGYNGSYRWDGIVLFSYEFGG